MPAPFLKVLWGHSFWKIKLALLFITLSELSRVRVEKPPGAPATVIPHHGTKAPPGPRGMETLPTEEKAQCWAGVLPQQEEHAEISHG